jgi:hypothetical protein
MQGKIVRFKPSLIQEEIMSKLSGKATFNRTILDDMKLMVQKPVLTYKARRQAKKFFPKNKQAPSGYTLMYRLANR